MSGIEPYLAIIGLFTVIWFVGFALSHWFRNMRDAFKNPGPGRTYWNRNNYD